MAKSRNAARASQGAANVPKSSDFNLTEIYRLIHLEAIPGFQMLRRERKYLDDYRRALRNEYSAEVKAKTVEEPVEEAVEETIEEESL